MLPALHSRHTKILDLECYDMFSRSPLYFQYLILLIPRQCINYFFSHMLCKTKHAFMTTRMVSSFEPIFLLSIPHLAFSLPKPHSIEFPPDLLIFMEIEEFANTLLSCTRLGHVHSIPTKRSLKSHAA